MIKTRGVVESPQLPKEIKDDLRLVRDFSGNGSYCEVDVLSDEHRDEWLERARDKYTEAECRVSDYLRSIGAKEDTSVVVLWWW